MRGWHLVGTWWSSRGKVEKVLIVIDVLSLVCSIFEHLSGADGRPAAIVFLVVLALLLLLWVATWWSTNRETDQGLWNGSLYVLGVSDIVPRYRRRTEFGGSSRGGGSSRYGGSSKYGESLVWMAISAHDGDVHYDGTLD